MKPSFKVILLIIICSLTSMGFSPKFANDYELYERDVKEIKSKARLVINELEAMLNLMTNVEVFQSEVQEVIENSYSTDNVNRLFRDKSVIVEDDLNPDILSSQQASNLEVYFYLSNFNLNYEKTSDYSIEFSEIKVSEIYYKDYPFLKVLFTRKYKSKNRRYINSFQEVERVAEIGIQKNSKGGWDVFIVGLRFSDQFGSMSEAPLVKVIKQESQIEEKIVEDDISEIEEDVPMENTQSTVFFVIEDKETALYNGFMADGNRAFKDERFEDAVLAFSEARKIRTNDPTSSVMLSRAQLKLEEQIGLGPEKLFDIYKKQGAMLEYRGEFEDAKNVYNRALQIKPNDQFVFAKSNAIKDRISAKNELENYFLAYNNRPRSKDLLKLTRSNPKNPDYKLGLAKAYFYERNPDEDVRKSKEIRSAMVVVNDALKMEPNFKDALLFRAELNLILGEYNKSFNDFEQLIKNENDEPELFFKRSLVKLASSDTLGAISDLNIASLQNPNDVKSYFELGKIFYNKYDFQNAAQNFGKASILERNNAFLHYFNAISLAEFDIPSSVKSFKVALELGTDSLEFKIFEQTKLFVEKSFRTRYEIGLEKALDNINNLSTLGFESNQILLRKGTILKELNRLSESKEAFESILINDPNSNSALVELAEINYLLEDFDKSIELYKKLESSIIMNPKRLSTNLGKLIGSKILNGLGNNYLALKDYATAYTYFTRSRDLGNVNPDIYLKLGISKMGQKDYKQAIKDFSIGINSYPNDYPPLLFNRGLVYFLEKNYQEASLDFNRAKNGTYQLAKVDFYLGMINLELDNPKSALEYFNESVKKDPENNEIYPYLFLLELYFGNYPQSETIMNTMSKIPSYNPIDLLTNQAFLNLTKGDSAEANRIQSTLMTRDPNNGKVLFLSGVIFYLQGKTDLSLDILEKAIKSNQLSRAEVFYNPYFEKILENKKFQRLIKQNYR